MGRQASQEILDIGDLVDGVVRQVTPEKAVVTVGNLVGHLKRHRLSKRSENITVDEILSVGDQIKALVIANKGKLVLDTGNLEQNHGDIVRDKAAMFENAEERHRLIRNRIDEDVAALERVLDPGDRNHAAIPKMVLLE